MLLRTRARRPITLVVSANTTNYNVFTAAGSPVDPVDVTVIVDAGVHIHSTSIGTPALTIGGPLAAGSTVLIVNNGFIDGKPGNGGNGGGVGNGTNGQLGGDAIGLTMSVTIDNTNGFVRAGGGGGGGGAALVAGLGIGSGGGGGGGQGDTSTGGLGGNAGNGGQGTAGSGGTDAAAGSRGLGGVDPFYGTAGGRGGNGGAFGAAGASGTSTSSATAGTGGAPGYAVRRNGHSVIWTGGNNASQVKGSDA